MKEYANYSAKTVDEAITKAMMELGISSDRLSYEVVEKGSAGILGMFSRPAVIRVCIPVENEDEYLLKDTVIKEAPVKEEKPVKPAAKPAAKPAEKPAKPAAKPAEKPAKPIAKPAEKSAKPAEKPVAKSEPAAVKAEEAVIVSAIEEISAEKENKPAAKPKRDRDNNRRERRDNRSHGGENKPARKNPSRDIEKQEKKEEKVYEKPVLVKPEDPETLAMLEKVEKFLAEMFAAMNITVTIETGFDEEEKTVQVNLIGDDMGVLIGKRGQTLDSIQYLSSLVVNKGEEEYIRVKVDTENYRERRKETLETLAKNISFKVKRTKRPVSLEPMNPYERRVIHACLQNDKYVVTRSEGVEPYRHIVISPKNTRFNGNRRDRSDKIRENSKENNTEE